MIKYHRSYISFEILNHFVPIIHANKQLKDRPNLVI